MGFHHEGRMPVGEERLVDPITLSDGTLLFMYYKYPLRQAFGGVLAEPIVVRHAEGDYRVRYESRDAEGRDRLEGARPIVTRDWKRSKWLNEFLIGLDELRLMGSLGGRGGPEDELYRILSDPKYREQLACYASKFPDESGSRLIVLNWVGPLAVPAADRIVPLAVKSRRAAASSAAPRVDLAQAATPRAGAGPIAKRQPGDAPPSQVVPLAHQQQRSRVVPLAHQGRSTHPAPVEKPAQKKGAPSEVESRSRVESESAQPSVVVPLAHQVSREPPAPSPEPARGEIPPEPAPVASGESELEDAGTRKLKLGMDSTQPVRLPSPESARQSISEPSAARTPTVPPAGQTPTAPAAAPPQESDPEITQRRTVDQIAAQPLPPSPVVPVAHRVSPDPPGPVLPDPIPIERNAAPDPLSPSIERRRSMQPPGVERSVGAADRPAKTGRASSMPPRWMFVGVALFGFVLLLAGWWLRGAAQQAPIVLPPAEQERPGTALASSGVAGPALARPEPAAGGSATANELNQDAGTEASGAVEPDDAAPAEVVPDTPKPQGEATDPAPAAEAAAPPPEQHETTRPAVRKTAPFAAPKPESSPPPRKPSETPLPAQSGSGAERRPAAEVQDWEDEIPGEASAAGSDVEPRVTRPPVVAAAPPLEPPPPVERTIPTLKITSAQMKEPQRNYLARVIKFLQPPLRYEWTPKFTRPAFFGALVTDGEPPECRIDFKEPTSITFDLVIRGGSGTESRIEDVEIIY